MRPIRFSCILAAAVVVAVPAMAPAQQGPPIPLTKEWTNNADWASGAEFNVNHAVVADELQLDTRNLLQVKTPYIWIANSKNSKVAMMNTRTGVVEQLIQVGPNPSRTAVDVINGVTWVGNRDASTVTKINSSTGAVVATYTVGRAPRALAIDEEGYLWVGNSLDDTVMKVRASDGAIIKTISTPGYPYGAAGDGRGNIWVVCRGGHKLYKISIKSESIVGQASVNGPYGIGIDFNGDAWVASYEGSCVHKVRGSDAAYLGCYPIGGQGRGVAVDNQGNVWVAASNVDKLFKVNGASGQVMASVATQSHPVGVGIDADGYVWTVNLISASATKVRISDAAFFGHFPTNGSEPYSYSDMTGFALQTFTLSKQGTWTVPFAAECIKDLQPPKWEKITWNATLPNGTEVYARARTAPTQAALQVAQWSGPFQSGANLNLSGVWLELQMVFKTADDSITPALKDVKVTYTRFPAQELCDGVDDNCNGAIDDGPLNEGNACTTVEAGPCAEGKFKCDGGSLICISSYTPKAEECNGIDDNCNGEVDEGNPGAGGACQTGLDGVCADGVLACEGGFLACKQQNSPEPEICDGKDNNCDGQIDDGDPQGGEPCDTGLPGICAAGTTKCQGGLSGCVQTNGAVIEICDGIDNDCDGVIDNGVKNKCTNFADCTTYETCEPCAPTPKEVCDAVDNDCNGQIDDDAEEICETKCGKSVKSCVGGILGDCSETQIGDEVCDGLDNDCNNKIDDNYKEKGQPCEAGSGDCATGTYSCESGVLVCNSNSAPGAEICDGKDNDCDGQVDNGDPGGGGLCNTGKKGICSVGREYCCSPVVQKNLQAQGLDCDMGVIVCVPRYNPREETCNRIDEDCDGVLDNGVQNACGTCDAEVPAEVCDGLDNDCDGKIDDGAKCASGDCINGQCRVPGCNAGECGPNEKCVTLNGAKYCLGNCDDVTCPKGETCNTASGLCEDLCKGVSCEDGQTCQAGKCVGASCLVSGGVTCAEDERCGTGGECKTDACVAKTCTTAELCTGGDCLPSCANVACGPGEHCESGKCVPAPCGGACGAQEICLEDLGACDKNPCADAKLDPGMACGGDGEIIPDPCLEVTCPVNQVCDLGDCRHVSDPPGGPSNTPEVPADPGDPVNPLTGTGPVPPPSGVGCTGEGCGSPPAACDGGPCIPDDDDDQPPPKTDPGTTPPGGPDECDPDLEDCGSPDDGELGEGTEGGLFVKDTPPEAPPPETVTPPSGCGCATPSGPGSAGDGFWLLLAGLAWYARRRSRLFS